jgi:hypothetical protein
MKLCINCKHRLDSEALPKDLEFSRCGFERPISLVTGRLRSAVELPYCSIDRARTGRCQIDAINWEAAEDVMTEEEELLKGSPVFPQGEAHE